LYKLYDETTCIGNLLLHESILSKSGLTKIKIALLLLMYEIALLLLMYEIALLLLMYEIALLLLMYEIALLLLLNG
jgi:hypothetical protein